MVGLFICLLVGFQGAFSSDSEVAQREATALLANVVPSSDAAEDTLETTVAFEGSGRRLQLMVTEIYSDPVSGKVGMKETRRIPVCQIKALSIIEAKISAEITRRYMVMVQYQPEDSGSPVYLSQQLEGQAPDSQNLAFLLRQYSLDTAKRIVEALGHLCQDGE